MCEKPLTEKGANELSGPKVIHPQECNLIYERYSRMIRISRFILVFIREPLFNINLLGQLFEGFGFRRKLEYILILFLSVLFWLLWLPNIIIFPIPFLPQGYLDEWRTGWYVGSCGGSV